MYSYVNSGLVDIRHDLGHMTVNATARSAAIKAAASPPFPCSPLSPSSNFLQTAILHQYIFLSSTMPQTRPRRTATASRSASKLALVHSGHARKLRSRWVISERPVSRPRATGVYPKFSGAAIVQDTATRTEPPTPIASSANEITDPAAAGETNSAETVEAHDQSHLATDGSITPDHNMNPLEGSVEEASEEPGNDSSALLREGSDVANDHSPSSQVDQGSTWNPIEIEDSDKTGFNYNDIRSIIVDLGLLDLFEESGDTEQFISYAHRNGNESRTLPYRESRDQARLRQRRDNHVGSTIRILHAVTDQVQSRNSCEKLDDVTGESANILKLEIAASGVTKVLIEVLQTLIADYRKDLLHSRRTQ